MLSLEKCRRLIPSNKTLSDSEITRLRDQLYCLADIALTSFLPPKTASNSGNTFIKASKALTDTQREAWHERSAIMEFEGNLPRSIAERMAFDGLRKDG